MTSNFIHAFIKVEPILDPLYDILMVQITTNYAKPMPTTHRHSSIYSYLSFRELFVNIKELGIICIYPNIKDGYAK